MPSHLHDLDEQKPNGIQKRPFTVIKNSDYHPSTLRCSHREQYDGMNEEPIMIHSEASDIPVASNREQESPNARRVSSWRRELIQPEEFLDNTTVGVQRPISSGSLREREQFTFTECRIRPQKIRTRVSEPSDDDSKQGSLASTRKVITPIHETEKSQPADSLRNVTREPEYRLSRPESRFDHSSRKQSKETGTEQSTTLSTASETSFEKAGPARTLDTPHTNNEPQFPTSSDHEADEAHVTSSLAFELVPPGLEPKLTRHKHSQRTDLIFGQAAGLAIGLGSSADTTLGCPLPCTKKAEEASNSKPDFESLALTSQMSRSDTTVAKSPRDLQHSGAREETSRLQSEPPGAEIQHAARPEETPCICTRKSKSRTIASKVAKWPTIPKTYHVRAADLTCSASHLPVPANEGGRPTSAGGNIPTEEDLYYLMMYRSRQRTDAERQLKLRQKVLESTNLRLTQENAEFKRQLEAALSEHEKVQVVKARLTTVTTFANGIGKDIDILRHDGKAFETSRKELITEACSLRQDFEDMKKVTSSIVNANEVRKGILTELCQKVEPLEKSLEETQTSLSATKNLLVKAERKNARFEKYLTQVSETQNRFSVDIQKEQKEMIGQLHSIAGMMSSLEAAMASINASNQSSEIIRCEEMLRSLAEAERVVPADMTRIAESVNALSESLTSQLIFLRENQQIAQGPDASIVDQITAHITALLDQLKASSTERENLSQLREHAAQLEERLKSSTSLETEIRVGKASAEAREVQQLRVIQEAVEELKHLREQFEALRYPPQRIDERDQLATWKLKLSQTSSTLAEKKSEVLTVTQQLRSLEREHNELLAKVSCEEGSENKGSESGESVNALRQQLIKTNQSHRQELEKLQAEFAKSVQDLNFAKQEVELLKAERKGLAEATKKAETVPALEHELRGNQILIDNLKEQISDRETGLANLRVLEERAAQEKKFEEVLQAQQNVATKMAGEISAFNMQLKELDEMKAASERSASEIASLRALLTQAQKAADMIPGLQEENETLLKKCGQLEEDLKQARRSNQASQQTGKHVNREEQRQIRIGEASRTPQPGNSSVDREDRSRRSGILHEGESPKMSDQFMDTNLPGSDQSMASTNDEGLSQGTVLVLQGLLTPDCQEQPRQTILHPQDEGAPSTSRRKVSRIATDMIAHAGAPVTDCALVRESQMQNNLNLDHTSLVTKATSTQGTTCIPETQCSVVAEIPESHGLRGEDLIGFSALTDIENVDEASDQERRISVYFAPTDHRGEALLDHDRGSKDSASKSRRGKASTGCGQKDAPRSSRAQAHDAQSCGESPLSQPPSSSYGDGMLLEESENLAHKDDKATKLSKSRAEHNEAPVQQLSPNRTRSGLERRTPVPGRGATEQKIPTTPRQPIMREKHRPNSAVKRQNEPDDTPVPQSSQDASKKLKRDLSAMDVPRPKKPSTESEFEDALSETNATRLNRLSLPKGGMKGSIAGRHVPVPGQLRPGTKKPRKNSRDNRYANRFNDPTA